MKVQVKYRFAAVLAGAIAASMVVAFANAPPASKSASRKPDARNNLKQLGSALLQYSQDYDDVLPPMKNAATVKQLLSPYVESQSVFLNPQTQKPFMPNPSLSGRNLDGVYKESYEKKQDMVAFYEASPKADGTRYVLALPKPLQYTKEGLPVWEYSAYNFMEPKVMNISKRDWPKVKKASNIP